MDDPVSDSHLSPKRSLVRELGIGFFLILGTLYLVGISAFYYVQTTEITEDIEAHAEQYFNTIDTTVQIVGLGPSLRRVVQSFSANRNVDRISIVDPRTGLVLEDSMQEKIRSQYDGSFEVDELKLDELSKIYSTSMQFEVIDMANPNSMPIPVVAVINLDVSEYFQRLTQKMIAASISFAIMVAAILLMIYGFVRKKLIVPIEKLEQEFREFETLAAGTYEPQTFEFFSLFKNFRKMAQKIKFQQIELDRERASMVHQAKLASLGEMSAGIAHEINNPLAIISGSAGLLSKFASHPEKLASKVETIQKSCDRIARIVSGLKKFSRSSEEKPNFETHRISDIIQETTALIETKSKSYRTSISIECSTQAQILCDEVEIEQVLVNLINNGIDAVKDKQEKWVKISVYEEGPTVVLRVMDSGLGIPESARAKLFEPFFTTKKVGEGTGLGLSITKGILDEHKATITVVADCPNTCFEIKFPKAEEI